MRWSRVNFIRFLELLPPFMIKAPTIQFFLSFFIVLDRLFAKTLYTMQHDGSTISLEKVLNEYFSVAGYDTSNHDDTKTVYIEDIPPEQDLFIFQNEEPTDVYLQGDDSEEDLFIRTDNESFESGHTWVIFIPDTYTFLEPNVRALVDTYRYIGNKYTIQTYTL